MIYINKLKRWQAALIAIFISFAIAFTTYTAQTRVTETVPDAQGGIVIVYSLIINVVLWLFLSIAIFHFMRALAQGHRFKSVITAALIFLFVGYAINTTYTAMQLNSALNAAADPTTSSHRLTELAKADIDYGYELDNRVAGNPSTPVDTLVSLYNKEGQIGTDLTLAANPNTPNDILIALSKRTNERWSDAIVKALKRNPKVRSGELTFDSSMTLQAN
tara:strand:- start:1613 stop:2269 length:657 start_codon:yes stop_codon:yes gene_type:complete